MTNQPTTTWIVMTVRIGSHNMWAWCRPTANGPGFDDIYYTETDGVSAADPGDEIPVMGTLVFAVTIPAETAEERRESAMHRLMPTTTETNGPDDV